ncbi:hypothetical protein [uncultured Thiodictyon sp.]|uniref:hypothetical protein n=1 Tax=uncultured Thiodictyon sp. TaxID=1846217 RepID=UPI0025FD76A2|nr:hypothetical protein [uncultured Thiodictyon sp.]
MLNATVVAVRLEGGRKHGTTVSLAMVAGLGLRRLARVIHAYPTQGEAIRQAAQACALSLARPVLLHKRETI